jgi:HK97 gp10 family phage protein
MWIMLDLKVVRVRQTNYPEVFKAINRNFLPKAGLIVLADAQRLVPVAKIHGGTLKGSLHSRVGRDQVSVGTNIHYAPYVEYGTYKMRAQPYLRPALDRNRKKLVALWADTYNKVFRVLGGRG